MQSTNFERHVNTFVHKILEVIKKHDHPISYSEIEEQTGINVLSNLQLVRALKANPKIAITPDTIRFIPTYEIRTLQDLIDIFKNVSGKEGIEMSKLLDTPVDVTPFIEQLETQGKIIILKDIDGAQIAFFNDQPIPETNQTVKDLWASIKVPNMNDVIQELGDNGLRGPEVQVLKNQKPAKQLKSRKSRRRITITNTHVKGLDLDNLDDSD